MLTRAQIKLIKMGQRAAGIADGEYRETLRNLCGVSSSTDPRVTDGQLDQLMAYFEAVYWRNVDQGRASTPCAPAAPNGAQGTARPTSVFRVRGYWAGKNPKGNSSRAQFTSTQINEEIHELEEQLSEFGCGQKYFAAIRRKTGEALFRYRAALQRTLDARRKNEDVPMERRPF